jgi:DNA-nicking Smr family endonuclease
MDPREDEPNSLLEVDLHRLTRAEAERRLARELHAARVRGVRRLLVITGRGWGNRTQEPVLRDHIEGWLAGPEGARNGVRSVRRVRRDGALEVTLAERGARPPD